MYQKDTILKAKVPKPELDKDHPYNRLRVIGPSPISYSNSTDWTGNEARGVVTEPLTEFGANWDEPFGWYQEHYDVESLPEPLVPNPFIARAPLDHMDINMRPMTMPTPEEIFKAAENGPIEEPEVKPRGRTKTNETT